MVIPDHFVHTVEVSVKLYDDILSRVASGNAYSRHGSFGAGVKKSELFNSGYKSRKILCKFKGLLGVVIHEEALVDALLKRCLDTRMLVAEHRGSRTAVVIDKLLSVHRVQTGSLSVIDIVGHAAGHVYSAACRDPAGHIFFALFPELFTSVKLHFQ